MKLLLIDNDLFYQMLLTMPTRVKKNEVEFII